MWQHGAELPMKLIPEKYRACAGSARRHCTANTLHAARPPMKREHVTYSCSFTQYQSTNTVWLVYVKIRSARSRLMIALRIEVNKRQ